MQPVTITNLDRLLTALIQAKRRGDLEQTVIDCLPVGPGDAHIIGVRADNGEIKSLIHFRFDQPLPSDYAAVLKRHGFQLTVEHFKQAP